MEGGCQRCGCYRYLAPCQVESEPKFASIHIDAAVSLSLYMWNKGRENAVCAVFFISSHFNKHSVNIRLKKPTYESNKIHLTQVDKIYIYILEMFAAIFKLECLFYINWEIHPIWSLFNFFFFCNQMWICSNAFALPGIVWRKHLMTFFPFLWTKCLVNLWGIINILLRDFVNIKMFPVFRKKILITISPVMPQSAMITAIHTVSLIVW